MTGSIPQLHRQHSSTAHSTMEKIYRPKLRRCSSADDHSPMESMGPMVNQQQKEFFSFKPATPTSDIDSGTEEIEQQLEQVFLSPPADQLVQFDEGFSEYEREEDRQLVKIHHDRKFHHPFDIFSSFLLGHYDSAQSCNCIILIFFF